MKNFQSNRPHLIPKSIGEKYSTDNADEIFIKISTRTREEIFKGIFKDVVTNVVTNETSVADTCSAFFFWNPFPPAQNTEKYTIVNSIFDNLDKILFKHYIS